MVRAHFSAPLLICSAIGSTGPFEGLGFGSSPNRSAKNKKRFYMKEKKLTDKEKLEGIRKALKSVISYPTKKQGRRTKDGYPSEFCYDTFAYKRMVDAFRESLKDILKEFS